MEEFQFEYLSKTGHVDILSTMLYVIGHGSNLLLFLLDLLWRLRRLPPLVRLRREVDDVDVNSLEPLESRWDGTEAKGDPVTLARHVLALNVGNVHEQLFVGTLKHKRASGIY